MCKSSHRTCEREWFGLNTSFIRRTMRVGAILLRCSSRVRRKHRRLCGDCGFWVRGICYFVAKDEEDACVHVFIIDFIIDTEGVGRAAICCSAAISFAIWTQLLGAIPDATRNDENDYDGDDWGRCQRKRRFIGRLGGK